MDEASEQLALFTEPPLNPDTFRLDRARQDVQDAVEGLRLQPQETRVLVWALRMWDADTLDGLASLLFKIRSDEPVRRR
jgi:hypothetical protein